MGYFTKGTFATFTFLGNVGNKDFTVIKHNGRDLPILKLQIAVNYKTKTGKEETHWLPVSLTGPPAEFHADKIKVGSKVLVTGPVRTRKWETNGKTRKTFLFQVSSLVFVSTKENTEVQVKENIEVPITDDNEEDEVPF